MSYFRASTQNPLGWRPGTALLGNPYSRQAQGPDWKTVVAQRDAAIRAQQNYQAAMRRREMVRMNAVDAYARGDRTRVVYRGLSGLGLDALDLNAKMVKGAMYVFHFRKTGVTLGVTDMGALAATVEADSNFTSVVAADEPNGFQVRFIFNGLIGPGSTVGAYGAEMQKVINDRNANGIGAFASALFSSAEGGPIQTPPTPTDVAKSGGVYATAPDGTILFNDGSVYDPGTGLRVNPDGSIVSASTTSPGGTQPGGGSPGSFDLNSLFSGLGIGGAIAAGLALLVVLKS